MCLLRFYCFHIKAAQCVSEFYVCIFPENQKYNQCLPLKRHKRMQFGEQFYVDHFSIANRVRAK